MTFQKGNKFGLLKKSEYDAMEQTEAPVDEEEITVPFVSQYPEGRGDQVPVSEASDVTDSMYVTELTAEEMSPSVKLMFHGALKDDGGKIIQRPIPQISKHVDTRDVVRIGSDRIGIFTKDEADYLLRVCKGAFTKA